VVTPHHEFDWSFRWETVATWLHFVTPRPQSRDDFSQDRLPGLEIFSGRSWCCDGQGGRAMVCRVLSVVLLVLLPSLILTPQGSTTSSIQDPPPPPQKAKPEAKPDPQDEVVRLSSRLVVVPVSASDAYGQPVKDLTVEDFVIEEEGKPQRIVALGEPGKTSVEIALVFDISDSIRARIAFEKQAATGFIKQVLKPGDAVSVFAIGTTPKMVKGRTTNGDEAIAGVMSIEPVKEATAFFDSIVEATLYTGKNAAGGSRRVLVVVSDGEENYSRLYKLPDALRELQKNDCLFYSINPSGQALKLNTISLKGQNYMESMSLQTGGKAFVPERFEDLEAVFRQIAEELQAQYLFGYYSTDERADGGFRKILVRAPKRADLRVRARQGYYAPKA
jgi:Ca-activated chloride channel homolog